MQIHKLTKADGKQTDILLSKFDALDGWDIQRRYTEFVMSTDKDFRRAYTLEILSYAKAIVNSNEYALATDALIDNHLGDWKAVKDVFEGVLKFNGIDPNTHAERPHYWANAGAEMAGAFLSQCSTLIGPVLAAVEQANQKD